MKLALLLAGFVSCASAIYSISYFDKANGCGNLINLRVLSGVTSEIQTADMYMRLSGNSPLLSEELVDGPSLNIFSDKANDLIVLEVFSDDVIHFVCKVTETSLLSERAPSLSSVLTVLESRNIKAEGTSTNTFETRTGIADWLQKQSKPVMILQHSSNTIRARQLQEDVLPLSEFQISQYQICLWTAVAFVLLVLGSVCSIVQMEVIPDSLLYAKFQSGRTGKIE